MAEVKEVTFKVEMTCSGCSGAVERVLKKLEGVEDFNVDLNEKKVVVRSALDPNTILQAIQKTGKKTEML